RLSISREVVARLKPRFDELGIRDVRSLDSPLGLMPHAQDHFDKMPRLQRRPALLLAQKAYVSPAGSNLAGSVMRFDLVFNQDPFERSSIQQLGVAEAAVREAMDEVLKAKSTGDEPVVSKDALGKTEIYTLGPTAGIRDLKTVTDRDQIRIDLLVMLAVYIVL